jgi:hypothetical protein
MFQILTFEAYLIYIQYKFHSLNLESFLLNFFLEYMKTNLYCMNDHHIVVCYLIVKVLIFLLVYIDYKVFGRLDLNSFLDMFRRMSVFCLRLLVFLIDS